MDTKALRKHYHKLADMERFRLLLAAHERDDESEIKALWETAPKKTYSMVGWPFRGMAEGIHLVTWAVVTDVLHAACIMLQCWGLCYVKDLQYSLTADGDDPDDPDEDDDDFDCWRSMMVWAESVVTAWDSLVLFCDELEITLEQALTQAPATGTAQNAVEFAQFILSMDDDFARWLVTEYLPEHGALPVEGDKLKAEREERIAERRRAKAREGADLIRQLWEMKTV